MYLMCKDLPVIRFDGNGCNVVKDNAYLLPISLRDSKVDLISVLNWVNSRVLPLTRANAKVLLGALNLSQSNPYKVAIACKGLSLTDSYWLKEDNLKATWKDVNLFENSLSKAISELAFTGHTYLSIQNDYATPELTAQGAYAKCWRRLNGSIYLYKSNTPKGSESENEFICSKLLDILRFDHVEYELCKYEGRTSSRCKIITSPDLAIVPMIDVHSFLQRKNIDLTEWLKRSHFDKFMEMLLFDGIVHNVDRHYSNWGMYMSNDSGELLDIHPLFDHNCAVDLSKESESKIFKGKSLLETASYAYRQLGRPRVVRDLKDYLESRDSCKLFDRTYTRDIERIFILNRVKSILEG